MVTTDLCGTGRGSACDDGPHSFNTKTPFEFLGDGRGVVVGDKVNRDTARYYPNPSPAELPSGVASKSKRTENSLDRSQGGGKIAFALRLDSTRARPA